MCSLIVFKVVALVSEPKLRVDSVSAASPACLSTTDEGRLANRCSGLHVCKKREDVRCRGSSG